RGLDLRGELQLQPVVIGHRMIGGGVDRDADGSCGIGQVDDLVAAGDVGVRHGSSFSDGSIPAYRRPPTPGPDSHSSGPRRARKEHPADGRCPGAAADPGHRGGGRAAPAARYVRTITDEPWPNRPWLAVMPTFAPSP